jgi:predicted DNA-binding protein
MPKPKGTEWVSTYLATEDKTRLAELAKAEGLSLAAYIRRMVTRHIQRKERT